MPGSVHFGEVPLRSRQDTTCQERFRSGHFQRYRIGHFGAGQGIEQEAEEEPTEEPRPEPKKGLFGRMFSKN